MLYGTLLLLLCVLGAFVQGTQLGKTALDSYMELPDPQYNWTIARTFSGGIFPYDYKAYILELTSQQWLTPADSSQPIWRHWVSVCVPREVTSNTAFIYIDGDRNINPKNPPDSVGDLVELVCLESGSISVHLNQIPNEPITFPGDPKHKSRTEDEIIAYTWAHFFNYTSEPYWLLRLPMVKGAVKTMDAVQELVSTLPGIPKVNDFMIAGASKRGWTTWLVPVVDKRVRAIVPLVIPVLNLVPNFNHIWRELGNWSFALDPYLDENIMDYLNKPCFQEMADIVDPFSYIDRLELPKFIICATGDEFTYPDSPQFFLSQLKGEKHLWEVPNAEHSLTGSQVEVAETVSTFFYMVVNGIERPTYNYTLIPSNTTASIIVDVDPNNLPTQVRLYQSTTLTNERRDWRLVVCDTPPLIDCFQPVFWHWTELQETGKIGRYEAKMNPPKSGWTAFYIELNWEIEKGYNPLDRAHWWTVSTEVNIVPDVLPFPPFVPPLDRKCGAK